MIDYRKIPAYRIKNLIGDLEILSKIRLLTDDTYVGYDNDLEYWKGLLVKKGENNDEVLEGANTVTHSTKV